MNTVEMHKSKLGEEIYCTSTLQLKSVGFFCCHSGFHCPSSVLSQLVVGHTSLICSLNGFQIKK